MKVSTMRAVDRWLGCSLVAVLTRCRKLLGWRRVRSVRRPRRVLFIKLSEQGSTVLAHAAIDRAVRTYGRDNVFFLAFEENRAILDEMDLIPRANVVTIRARSIAGSLISACRSVVTLRRMQIDATIDLEFFARSSALLAFLSGARMRAGYHSFAGEGPYRGDLLTHRLLYNPYVHTADAFDMMVAALSSLPQSLPATDLTRRSCARSLPPRIRPSRDEVAAVAARLRQSFGEDHDAPFVLLNANCSDLMPLRKWPDEKYVELAARLLGLDPALRIVFSGGEGEEASVGDLVGKVQSKRCVSMAGKTSLREFLVLCSMADVLVTNDSGPAHFASLVGASCIVLFGPETPELFAPLSSGTHVIWKRTICSPCVSAYNNRVSPCENNVCMQAISVGEVFDCVCTIRDAKGVGASGRRPERSRA